MGAESVASLVRPSRTAGEVSRLQPLIICRNRRYQSTYLANLLLQMYVKCGSLGDAESVFQSIGQPNVYSWTIMVAAYAQSRQTQKAGVLFASMPERNSVCWNALLRGYVTNGDVETARQILFRFPQWETASWNMLLLAYARRGHAQEAKLMFDRMQYRDVISWTALIQGSLSEATSVFELMPQRDTVACNAVIAWIARNGDLLQAKIMFDTMVSRDHVSFNTMIQGYLEKALIEEAKVMCDSMPMQDSMSCNMVMKALVALEDLQGARLVFDAMRWRTIESWTALIQAHGGSSVGLATVLKRMPAWDPVSWTAVINTYTQLGCLEEARAAFDSAVYRDSGTWNTLLAAYVYHSHAAARCLFSLMPMWTWRSWNAVVHSYLLAGKRDEARAVFHDMAERELTSWNLMLGHQADSRQAEELHSRMPHWDVVSWTSMLQAYAAAGDLGSARSLFHRQPQRNILSWNTMLSAYVHAGSLHSAEALLNLCPRWDVVGCNTLMAAYAQLEPARATRLFEAMPGRDSVSWAVLVTGYTQSQRLDVAAQAFERMPLHNLVSANAMLLVHALAGRAQQAAALLLSSSTWHVSSWNVMAAAYAHLGYGTDALQLFRSMQLWGVQPDEYSFMSYIAACSRAGLLAPARDCVMSMLSDYDLVPLREHYSCLVDTLGRCGKLELASELAGGMPFQPAHTFTLRALLASGNTQGDAAAQYVTIAQLSSMNQTLAVT